MIGSSEKRIVKDALWDSNPITYQVLGICSALAVTVQVKTALVMCAALTFVLCMSNVIVSLMRHLIPNKIRIIIELSVISSLVILADQFLKAYMFDVSKQLSVFVGLIITNCIILGRAEGYAMQNPPFKAFLDGLGNSLGYSAVLLFVAVGRELFGSGSLLGYQLVPAAAYEHGYIDNGLMLLAPGAFFLLGAAIWVQRYFSGYREE
ncbi:MAG: NADH:ubiquinone reductase (Na(+)-transporting) subunit D [Candidatus Omnitrophota bacterium]